MKTEILQSTDYSHELRRAAPRSSDKPYILWPPAPRAPRLNPGCVHLWCAWLDDPADDPSLLAGLLSIDERLRAQDLRFARDWRRFIVARALLRRILAYYLEASPSILRFNYNTSGKPAVAFPGSEPELQFNLSHSGALALYAVAWNDSLGVDVEEIRALDGLTESIARLFAPAETEMLRRLPPSESLETFFQLWTMKEAIAKAVGTDLDESLQTEVDFVFDDEQSRGEADRPSDVPWRLMKLQPAFGYAGALATLRSRPSLHCWHFPPSAENDGFFPT